MAILIECLYCHRKQGLKNKKCINKNCNMPLEKDRKNGKLHYWITYRFATRHIWELTTPNPFSIKDAQDCEGKRRGQRREGTLQILDIKGTPPVTFGELADHYLVQDFNKQKKSYDSLCARVNSFKKIFGTREIGSIANSEIKNYQAKRCTEIARSTVDQEMVYAKAVIEQAIADKKAPKDAIEIFNGIKKVLKKNANTGKSENAKDLIFTNDEMSNLYTTIAERSKLPFILLALTGMREGEALKLEWSRVNVEQALIELKPGDTKEGKAKQIPIPNDIITLLWRLRANTTGDKIFNLTKDQFIRDFKVACKLAGIKYGRKNGATVHTLRHSFVTRASGIPQLYRKMLTGHSSAEMDERYSHPKIEDLRGAMETVNKSVNILPLIANESREDNHLTH